jgi:acyl carrier protein
MQRAVADTLNVKPEEVRPETSLVRDLEAESLDFLDINYRVEQTFDIKMARHTMLEHVEELFGEGSAVDDDGCLTGRAVRLLKIRFGDEVSDLQPGMDMDDVPALVTVQSMVDGVADILDSLPEKCPQCGAEAWVSEDSVHVKCGECGAPAVYRSGDELIRAWLERVQGDSDPERPT